MYVRTRGRLGQVSTLSPVPQPATASLFQRTREAIQEAVRRGQATLAMAQALLRGLAEGMRDVNDLTNLVFFARHPERGGRKLQRGEPQFAQLSREWLEIRDKLVLPTLQAAAAGPASVVPTSPTDRPRHNWAKVAPDQRMLYVMKLLVEKYQYPVNGAAGIVGNLWAESKVLPNRVEGSSSTAPMRARDFKGAITEFTAEQVMNRNPAKKQGPKKAGIGLAQWTRRPRRAGLFQHTFQGRRLGATILYDMDAQVNYLVTELGSKDYRHVDRVLRDPHVSLEDASDEVVYNFEIPGSILTKTKPPRKLARTDPAVQEKFVERRRYARVALGVYRRAHPGIAAATM